MLWIVVAILLIILIFLIFKLYFIKKSINDISNLINEILKSDTNNLITISSSDKDIIKLTQKLNCELQELRTQKLQYQYGNNELKNTITNISHDLRTPLTAINGYVDLLKEQNLSNKQEEYINIVNNKTCELISLTEQLFDFSKNLDLKDDINKENCCINDILEESIASYYTLFKETNIVPNIKICNKKIYVNINKSMLIRIFENLISNTIKYSNGDCNIILEENGKITFSNKTNILDSTTVKKIFDRYYTVENAKKNSGIGLSIAKQLVELNSGTIIAKYEKNILIIQIQF